MVVLAEDHIWDSPAILDALDLLASVHSQRIPGQSFSPFAAIWCRVIAILFHKIAVGPLLDEITPIVRCGFTLGEFLANSFVIGIPPTEISILIATRTGPIDLPVDPVLLPLIPRREFVPLTADYTAFTAYLLRFLRFESTPVFDIFT
jgi:hypothetical protein